MSISFRTLTFLHPHLTPTTPTNTSLKLLTKELYANVHAVPSTHSGGGHGHLGLVMPVAKYIIAAGIMFQLPAHPGLVPVHAAGANAATHQESICLYDLVLKELTISTTIQEEVKKQLPATVD